MALLPNLVQTLEGNPALVHGGPFANIAHGCNSLIATRYALSRAPIVVTEAGFASELGAEKFCDIKCRIGGIKPHLAVVVATIKALKLHGGVSETDLKIENVEALRYGFQNLVQHIENMKKFGLQVLVALNVFNDDFTNEINEFTRFMAEENYAYSLVTSVKDGSIGGLDFADKVVTMLKHDNQFQFLYDNKDNVKCKIGKISRDLYRADGVKYSQRALKELANIEALGFGHLPVCMAKTPLSFSDNPLLKNAPRGFKITIREFRLSAGAGFIVALTGKVLTMPGLPKVPAAVRMKEVR
jgi:formate--tetrahydrofolate ligase